MKFLITLVLAAGINAVTANVIGTSVKLFTKTGCIQEDELALDKTVLTGTDCVAISGAITVPELGQSYNYVRLSTHVENEILLYESANSCAVAPIAFDATQQTPFLRVDTAGACMPCYRCGNIQSLRFDPVDETETPTSNPSSARDFTPSSAIASFLFGVAALLL